MNRKAHSRPHQTPLPLNGDVHWIQLPAEVREQSRALVVELLKKLAHSPATGGDDER